jgi:hypothetical protein
MKWYQRSFVRVALVGALVVMAAVAYVSRSRVVLESADGKQRFVYTCGASFRAQVGSLEVLGNELKKVTNYAQIEGETIPLLQIVGALNRYDFRETERLLVEFKCKHTLNYELLLSP